MKHIFSILSDFKRDDSGAVTVEWVVLSAATIVMMFMIVGKMEGYSLATIASMFS